MSSSRKARQSPSLEPPINSIPVTETNEHRAAVTWEGPGEPIMLEICGPAGEAAIPLSPTRALELARELLTHGVQAIKADQWGAE